jgi:hypothetical protein
MGGTIIVPAATSTFPGSGTKTLAQMRGDIARIAGVLDDPAMEALATKFMNDIIDDLNRRQVWLFNVVTSPDITTSPGVSSYAIPSDFLRVYNARKTDSIDYQLSILGRKTFDTMFQSQRDINGYPYTLNIKNAFRDGTVGLFPAPDAAYTISINYFKLIGRLTQENDTLDLPIQYESVVTNGAQAKMMATLSQYDGAKYWGDLYERDYQYMKRADEDSGGDEELRLINIEEIAARGMNFLNPAARPRAYDLW